MDIPVIFITIPYADLLHPADGPKETNVGLNLFINTTEFDLEKIANSVTQYQCRFTLSISSSILSRINVDILSDIYMIFCFSDYMRKNKNRIYIIQEPQTEKIGNSIAMLQDYFRLQSEEETEFIVVPSLLNGFEFKNTLFIQVEALKALDETFLQTMSDKKINQFIVSGTNAASIYGFDKEQRVSIKSDSLLKRMIDRATIQLKLDWLTAESALWKERVNLYLSFVSLSKKVSETQYYSLIEWYNAEYEVLPLWYKRFGHILKWLKGKKNISLMSRDKSLKK